MSDFRKVMEEYLKRTIDKNDRRIISTALNLLDLEPIITDGEIDVLNEIFKSLREDYTLSITRDRETLKYKILISKQEAPVIENKHDVNTLYNKLSSLNINFSKLEKSILTFFNACEHVEEDEVIIIDDIVLLLENSCALKPIEIENGIKYSKIITNYQRTLVKTK